MRIGYGYDVHRFKQGRPLILGGVDVPYEKGLEGHSDADVLLHAITDALLGALSLGDIGTHFPDTSPEFENADSRIFLSKTMKMIQDRGYNIGNIDATIVAQRPKLLPFINEMRNNIAEDLKCDPADISVKATTAEKMGFVGREEGIAAMAVVLIKPL